jgi:hypothetical protein
LIYLIQSEEEGYGWRTFGTMIDFDTAVGVATRVAQAHRCRTRILGEHEGGAVNSWPLFRSWGEENFLYEDDEETFDFQEVNWLEDGF